MTPLREEIRKLAEKAVDSPYYDGCESAVLAGIKLVLEQEPSQEMLIAGALHSRASVRYRAMTAQLLKELE